MHLYLSKTNSGIRQLDHLTRRNHDNICKACMYNVDICKKYDQSIYQSIYTRDPLSGCRKWRLKV